MIMTRNQITQYSHILILSAWGFAIAISSFLFLYIGYWLDKVFNTAPTFMLGLFFLAVFLCIGRLYQDAWQRRNMESR
ncbi:MAG: AtpZ/AtpI family protein [Syntrophales bacterium]|nr:AtpZ/AtpI family protein [Syntrophales bacterium]